MKSIPCSLTPLVSIDQTGYPIDWEKVSSRNAPVEVEIGFGMGEVIIRSAQDNPDRLFVGIEQHWDRIFKTIKQIDRLQKSHKSSTYLSNIRILNIDAWLAFERVFMPKSLDRIICLFPCPWPKKKHVKHRLFSTDFLKLVNNRLKSDGEVYLVTDFKPYFDWIQTQLDETGFEVLTGTTEAKYNTKFERKWVGRGQKQFYELTFLKKQHVGIEEKRDIELKSYRLKNFDPDKFKFENLTGEISVIYKDMIYDEKQKRAMIHVVVSEENLNQHFWASVVKKDDDWQVHRSDGQTFFPTPGIYKALDLISEAAKNSC